MLELKLPRLLAAAKEFNVGQDTIVDFLVGKGFNRDDLKPTAKLSEDMYRSLQHQFQGDKVAKNKADLVEIPKGVQQEGRKKRDEEEILFNKKDLPKPPTPQPQHPAPEPTPEPVVERKAPEPVAETVEQQPQEAPQPEVKPRTEAEIQPLPKAVEVAPNVPDENMPAAVIGTTNDVPSTAGAAELPAEAAATAVENNTTSPDANEQQN